MLTHVTTSAFHEKGLFTQLRHKKLFVIIHAYEILIISLDNYCKKFERPTNVLTHHTPAYNAK